MSISYTNIHFEDIKNDLINHFKNHQVFKEINSEGSVINFLFDVFAYISHYNMFMLNTSLNECFLPSAELRENVTPSARTLNYIPRRPCGAVATISIEIINQYKPVDLTSILIIPKYTLLKNSTFMFYVSDEYILNSTNNYKLDYVLIKQGEYRSISFISNGTPDQEFIIESEKIDNDTLNVYVDGVLWTLDNNIISYDENSNKYQVELTNLSYVKILFGDGIIGKIPDNTSNIEVHYTLTDGLEGNGFNVFNLDTILLDNYNAIYDNSRFIITTIENASGGSDIESVASIKNNAPKFYASQGRLVSADDYISYLMRHQLVEDVTVYDQTTDTLAPIYGQVSIAVKPIAQLNLTYTQKNLLSAYISDLNVMTIKPIFVNINYIYVSLTGTIFFNQIYESQLSEVRNIVNNSVNDFFNSMSKFTNIFKSAKLISQLNSLDVVGNTNIEIVPYIYFDKSSNGAYIFQLNNFIVVGSLMCDIINGNFNEGFFDLNGRLITKKDFVTVIGEINYVVGSIEIYPDYAIDAVEPELGFKLFFKTKYDDIHYVKNNSITFGNSTFIFSRYLGI